MPGGPAALDIEREALGLCRRAFLELPGLEVVEIGDLWQARQHIWAVAHAVFGEGTPVAAWAEPLCQRLLLEGAPPVLQALRGLAEGESTAGHEVCLALEYFDRHVPRMRYPKFAAAGLPLGSSLVESGCKLVVEARQKGAGMRWGPKGGQTVASLRAVHRSGQWTGFWPSQPQMRRPAIRDLVHPAA